MKRSLIVQHEKDGQNTELFHHLSILCPFKILISEKTKTSKETFSDGYNLSPVSKVNFSLFFNKFMFRPPGKQTFSIQPNKELDTSYLKHLEFIKTQSDHCVTLKLIGPLALGLGNSHPSENGINFHHLWNVPLISASSLKGVVRAWAEETGQCKETIVRFFGPDNNTTNDNQGEVIFFDALPVIPDKGITVFVDTITPHYGEYYKSGTKEKYPTDWQQPVPINFIAIAPGCQFQFAVKFRNQKKETDKFEQEDIKTLELWLRNALEENGIGAKTAQGYGHFGGDCPSSTKPPAWRADDKWI